MNQQNIVTKTQNTWCIGCGNFAILTAIKVVINELISEGCPSENIVLVSGIGCHAKIVDYLNLNSFYSLHGRTLPVAEGIKIAKPSTKVIVFAGDGDAYGEGMEHLIFAAKRNIDITMIVHNNRVYGLTTGQYTPTSPFDFHGRSTPKGTKELPLNPLHLMLAGGATFLARGTSFGLNLLKKNFKEAIIHKGFSLVDVLQVCVTFFNLYEYYGERIYELKDHQKDDYSKALEKIREWDYNADSKIPTGIFYQKLRDTFETGFTDKEVDNEQRYEKIKEFLQKTI
ncbi:2-oxoacid:ferredoxin oxidoreductase subunit beta [Candidatus Desantisbacteria bacterium]|nr:2-oxoacid:ferredoxin oxidoreductase subunit beta [Candidatus Desantisbacteria bacterium]